MYIREKAWAGSEGLLLLAADCSTGAVLPNHPANVFVMAASLMRVDIQGTRLDGSSFLVRTWVDVEEVRRQGETRSRYIIEVRQPFLWGIPAGPLTTQTLHRHRVAARRRAKRRTSAQRTQQSEQFRERLRVFREAIEEYGVPAAHARWSPEDAAGRRRAREEEEWQRNVCSWAA